MSWNDRLPYAMMNTSASIKSGWKIWILWRGTMSRVNHDKSRIGEARFALYAAALVIAVFSGVIWWLFS
jgi:hypothetical protein